ncbi:uncharacterized protein LOC117065750 isoform X2 [Trachypithecus francoisi]|uniref:uncharacterized protein LOC117065750 isoform X2 n=1 Tax=Trachypithecus francoisi TaxID=54180 RepID=UPI00141B8E80|nr:uncharacterized protein LOC117065750 isoform X2 [Trachypithecus francoisi]
MLLYFSCCRYCLRKLCPSAALILCLALLAWCRVVEDATEVEMSDSKAASELYLQATAGEGRACCLLTLIVSCPGPDPPEEPGTQGVWRGALQILQLPGALDCPLLRVLAGEVVGEEAEGSLPWIVSQLLEGNNYSGLLLRLDPQGSSLSLLQAALLGASRRRMQVKQVRPTLWDAVEEARAGRAGLRPLRLGLLEDTLTYSGLSQLGRALRELEVVKACSQHPRRKMLQGARAEAMRLPEPQQVIESPVSQSPCLKGEPQVAGRTATLRCGLHQKNPLRHPKEQTSDRAQQVPDVALQFFLAQARRQRLREQHQIWIREKLKHLEQKEEVADDQIKDLVAEEEACKERQRWQQEQMVLRFQLEALQEEWDTAQQDLAALYDLHVQATRAQTHHVLWGYPFIHRSPEDNLAALTSPAFLTRHLLQGC